MRQFTILLFTGLFFMTLIAPGLAAGKPEVKPGSGAATAPQGQAEITRLSNGLTVLVKEDHRFPLVSLRLYVRAGAAYERPEEAGISHLLEHMVFRGTEKRPDGKIALEVESAGGYLNAYTGFDSTVYLTDMTAENWKVGLDVLKDMAFHPELNPEHLAAEKDVVVAELKRNEDDPGRRLFLMSQKTALKGTPYFEPIIGYEETVRGFTSDDIRAYINRLYQPQSMQLVVCGDIKADEVLAEAERLFGDLKNTSSTNPPAPLADSMKPQGFRTTIEEGPWSKVYLSLAVPAPGSKDARAPQLDVLSQALGGDASSRFYRTYKYDLRLVDGISVSNYSFERLGMLFIEATLDVDKLVPFWEALSKELAQLDKATFSTEELNRARLNIEDTLYRSKETLAGLASKLGYFAFFDDGEQGEINYLRNVGDTDQRVLLELIKSYFNPDALSLSVLMPQGTKMPEELDTKAASWEEWFARTLTAKWPSTEAGKGVAAAAGEKGETEVIELGQGRTLVLIPDSTLPYTSVNMLFTGGDAMLAEKDQGLAAFTAALLTKGTKELSATDLEDYLSDRAAGLKAGAGRQTFSLSMSSPAAYTADMFNLLRSTLTEPALLEDEAARVRDNQTTAITMREEQPTGLAFRRMFPFFFPGHPYGYLQLGEKERVAKFNAREAASFWKEQAAQPWVLAVCGLFDRDGVIEAAKQLPVPSKKEKTPGDVHWGKERTLDLTLPERNQAHFFMVFPTVGYGTEDEPGLDLLQSILEGQGGLLFRDLRDVQGLGYTVTAFNWKTEKTGALIFYIGTEPDKIAQAEQGFRKIITELQDNPLPEAEIERGKNQMMGDYYRNHQSLASRSSEAAVLTVLHRPLDAARKLVDKAQKVDAGQLQKLARDYLKPENSYMVKVLP